MMLHIHIARPPHLSSRHHPEKLESWYPWASGLVRLGGLSSSGAPAGGACPCRCSVDMYLPTPSRSAFGRLTGPLYQACASSAALLAWSAAAAPTGSASRAWAACISLSRVSNGSTSTVMPEIETGSAGRSSLSVGTRSILARASKPPTTLPKTVCLPSRWAADLNVMKNCDPFVFGPELAIDSTPLPSCLSLAIGSSANGFPHLDSPPVPVPVGSPPCTMKFFNSRWKGRPS
mmetsp:Transcript_8347/g.27546  ORF Transcript_8347/g.27546 Transcript_8347/m.27546 type:complete len:233 (+) Transcript_8347:126-824(+)